MRACDFVLCSLHLSVSRHWLSVFGMVETCTEMHDTGSELVCWLSGRTRPATRTCVTVVLRRFALKSITPAVEGVRYLQCLLSRLLGLESHRDWVSLALSSPLFLDSQFTLWEMLGTMEHPFGTAVREAAPCPFRSQKRPSEISCVV